MGIVKITNRSQCLEAPFTEDQLLKIINEHYALEPKALIERIGHELDKISSKHKFIIQCTKMKVESQKIDLNIETDFVAYWEPSKDGCITVQMNRDLDSSSPSSPSSSSEKVEHASENTARALLLTVYWISV
ncbi:hypothetical protein KGF56_002784 [Candida oxycetoniae]|uniref:Topoisomerase I damage affected protein 2 n=1 Tax=Candida oxycetoniae TaxID=497107 RepID=A0AAI9SX56_9ASCO|nr:uncharacterized protein KGF56_002784 [Candida oxycetoniae]KAI3404387.1 hypothetical protein KGF56_002784 [Candida oxycetoniae]